MNVYSLPENEDESEEECDKNAADEFPHLEVPRRKGKGAFVIVIVIYFTFRRSMIGNKTFGYGTSLNTRNSYICNTTYNCLMKVKLVIKLALVV